MTRLPVGGGIWGTGYRGQKGEARGQRVGHPTSRQHEAGELGVGHTVGVFSAGLRNLGGGLP